MDNKELQAELERLKAENAQLSADRTKYRSQIRLGEERAKFEKAAIDAGCDPEWADAYFILIKEKGHISYDAEKDSLELWGVPSALPVANHRELVEHTKMLNKKFFEPVPQGQAVAPKREYNPNSLTDRTAQYLESQQQKQPIAIPKTNPWKTGNLTEQTRIFNADPALAQKLQQEAG